jgi:DNA uptake protein ComE-like DNA-binding protein
MNTRTVPAVLALAFSLACAGGDTDSPDAAADTSAVTRTMEPAPAAPSGSEFIDPDGASREDLLALPGMDSAGADALIAGRPYATMVAVDSVLAPHLSETERDTVYARLWKRIDLNTASEQEILLIPGVGARMQHEFEEYRPYASMEVFRREIGKYVDDAEVARLERYVEIR